MFFARLGRVLRYRFSSKQTRSREEIFEKLRSKQELETHNEQINKYRERGGVMIRYLLYRKVEVIGLLLLSAGIYLTYKLYSIGGVLVNPLTQKKNLACLNPESEVRVANEIERVFRLERVIKDKTVDKCLSFVLEDIKALTNQSVEAVVIDNCSNIVMLLPNNKLIISKKALLNYPPQQLKQIILFNHASLKLFHVIKDLHYSEIVDIMGFLFWRKASLKSAIKLRQLYANRLSVEQYQQCKQYLREKHQIEGSLDQVEIGKDFQNNRSKLSVQYKLQNCV